MTSFLLLTDVYVKPFHVVVSDAGSCGNDRTVSSDCTAVGGVVSRGARTEDTEMCALLKMCTY